MNFGGPLAPILQLVRGHAIAVSLRESLNRLSELAVADSVAQSSSE